MLKWTQPNREQLDYWESETGGFWVTSRNFYSTSTGKSRKRWVLYGGELELGVYDSLDGAKEEAEPHDEEQEEDAMLDECDWDSLKGSEPQGSGAGVDLFHRYLQEEPL